MTAIINAMDARGNTALLDAVWEAYIYLVQEDDREAINAIVVMTDGQENASNLSLRELQKRFAQESGAPIVVFTIGFGDDVDDAMLEDIARIGGGQYRRANETDIQELYRVISTYF
jgi:Ca-activated chloride channel family protein